MPFVNYAILLSMIVISISSRQMPFAISDANADWIVYYGLLVCMIVENRNQKFILIWNVASPDGFCYHCHFDRWHSGFYYHYLFFVQGSSGIICSTPFG